MLWASGDDPIHAEREWRGIPSRSSDENSTLRVFPSTRKLVTAGDRMAVT